MGPYRKSHYQILDFCERKAKGLLGKIGLGKLRSDKKEDVDTIPDGREKLFAKLRNNEEKINVDGGHRLKFENEGELAVYSTRIGFNELLRQKQEEIHANKTSSDYSKKQDALNKLNIDKKNFGKELSKYRGKQDKKYSANVKEEYNAMKDILVSVASSLEIIGVTSLETTSLLPTNVTHTTQGKKAKEVIAQPLTKIPGNTHGSSPGSSVPVGWEQIDPDQRSDFWVRAHLLNHHLHGPGVEWNLFPAHKDINKGMELAVENPAKKAIAVNENKSYFYETNLAYGAGDFPTHIKVEFGEYDVKTGKRTPSPYGFDKPLEIPESYTVNINTATAACLQQVAKANEIKGMTGFFKDLVNERNKNGVFNDIGEIRARLDPKMREKIRELINLVNNGKLNI
jgi:DNA uptake protein ComE-like DNA-binding protein